MSQTNEALEATATAVTNTMIEALSEGARPWESRIDRSGNYSNGGLPYNPVTGTHYSGVNIGMLLLASWEKGYDLPIWMTYRNALELKAQVRRGERSTKVIHFKWVEKKDKNGKPILDSRGRPEVFAKTSVSNVFNARQIDGLPPEHTSPVKAVRMPDPGLDAFFANVGATIHHNSTTQPCYRHKPDTIWMPNRPLFKTIDGYYATLAHELCHWTMAKDRLDRRYTLNWIQQTLEARLKADEASEAAYRVEELVAELGASIICVYLGIQPVANPRDDSVAYLQHYIRLLQTDNKMLLKVAKLAADAAAYVVGRGKGRVTAMVPVQTTRALVTVKKRKGGTTRNVAKARAKKAAATCRTKVHAFAA